VTPRDASGLVGWREGRSVYGHGGGHHVTPRDSSGLVGWRKRRSVYGHGGGYHVTRQGWLGGAKDALFQW